MPLVLPASRQLGAGMRQRGHRRQRVVEFVADDPDHLLPGLHFLPAQFGGELAQQQQFVRAPVEPETAAGQVVDLFLVAIADYIRSGQEKGQHFADVDPEAYVLHVLQLVISAAASADVTGIVLLESLDQGRPSRRHGATHGGEPEDSRNRYDKELVRIARASLFPPALQTTKNGRGKKR